MFSTLPNGSTQCRHLLGDLVIRTRCAQKSCWDDDISVMWFSVPVLLLCHIFARGSQGDWQVFVVHGCNFLRWRARVASVHYQQCLDLCMFPKVSEGTFQHPIWPYHHFSSQFVGLLEHRCGPWEWLDVSSLHLTSSRIYWICWNNGVMSELQLRPLPPSRSRTRSSGLSKSRPWTVIMPVVLLLFSVILYSSVKFNCTHLE